MMTEPALAIFFFIIALLYSSVGHGGASGYIAVMALLHFAPPTIRSTALVLNVVASGIAFIQFYSAHRMPFKLFLPLVITGIPAAYLGALIPAEGRMYTIVLGCTLLFAAWRLLVPVFNKQGFEEYALTEVKTERAMLCGAAIGLLSGWLGIGGGILLSPLLILMRWSSVYHTASLSAAFILVNSLSGIVALRSNLSTLHPDIIMLAGIVAIGGMLGAYLGSNRFNKKVVRYVLSTVLSLSALRLIFGS